MLFNKSIFTCTSRYRVENGADMAGKQVDMFNCNRMPDFLMKTGWVAISHAVCS